MTLKDPELLTKTAPADKPLGQLLDRPLAPAPMGRIRNGLPPGRTKFTEQSGLLSVPKIFVIYGPGGIGKTTFACSAPDHKLMDVEKGSDRVNADRIMPENGWDFLTVREALRTPSLYKDRKCLIIDSLTRVEDMAVEYVIANVKKDSGESVEGLEDYGWGKGKQHVYEAMNAFMVDCEYAVSQGVNVILIAHEVVSDTIDTVSGDHKQFHMRLQEGKKTNVANMVRDMAREVWFYGPEFKMRKVKDGKGALVDDDRALPGTLNRTLHPVQGTGYVAKSAIFKENILITSINDYKKIWAEALKG